VEMKKKEGRRATFGHRPDGEGLGGPGMASSINDRLLQEHDEDRVFESAVASREGARRSIWATFRDTRLQRQAVVERSAQRRPSRS